MRLFGFRRRLFVGVLRLNHRRLIRMLGLMGRLRLMRMLGLMCLLRLMRLLRLMSLLWLMIGMRLLGLMIGLLLGLMLRLVGFITILAALVLAVAVRMSAVRLSTVTGEGILVRELSITASENGGAGGHHFVTKGELLAVEDEGVLVVVEIGRGKAAQVGRSGDLGGRVVDCGPVGGLVGVGILVADTNNRVASRDPPDQRAGVIAQVPDGCLEGLKSDENLSLHLDSLHIVVLVPDLLVLPELVDLLVEISAGQRLTVGLRVVWRPVHAADVEALTTGATLLLVCWVADSARCQNCRGQGC